MDNNINMTSKILFSVVGSIYLYILYQKKNIYEIPDYKKYKRYHYIK